MQLTNSKVKRKGAAYLQIFTKTTITTTITTKITTIITTTTIAITPTITTTTTIKPKMTTTTIMMTIRSDYSVDDADCDHR